MRSALELVTTAHPASAKRGSISAAMEASSAAKITLGAPSGVAGATRISATLRGNGCLQFPARGFAIGTALGAVRSRQPRDFKPGMMLQHLHKALPDNTGSAQNSDRDFRSHKGFLGFYNTGRLHALRPADT